MSPKAEIEVTPVEPKGEPKAFKVVVREGRSETTHQVTVSEAELRRFGGGKVGPAALVKESFRFLLERESKESILGRFELSVISRYFPEFEREIVIRLGGGGC
jgi:hypothetical protein